jgi:hypothetical protein
VKLHSYYVKETTKYEHLTHPKLASPLDITTYNDISSFIKGHSEIIKCVACDCSEIVVVVFVLFFLLFLLFFLGLSITRLFYFS